MKEIYVSDPHGQYDQLIANLAMVRQNVLHGFEDCLHFIGDVYDRGPCPDLVMEELLRQPTIDVQWGNHDIVWLGAALGQPACVANVVRICARYNNLNILKQVYGIDLTPLFYLAKYAYKDIPCDLFVPKESGDLGDEERRAIARGQKAMAIIQFKIEAKISRENPDFNLERRNLLHCIDYEKRLVTIEGAEYDMLDINLPTVDRDDPYKLTKEEQEVLDHLVREFTNCAKLQRHIMLFLERGSLYKIDGNMLLFHACVPMNPDGTLMEVEMGGQKYKGRALFDAVDARVRSVLTATGPERKRALDVLWYLWLGEGSPLFAKSKMATFELYFCSDKNIRKEKKNAFYSLLDNEEALDTIFRDFGMNPATSHMVCGHTPIKVKDGEDPVKCGGKVIMIDGGMSKAYQGTSGIAGFTLVSQNEKLTLVSHQPVQASSAHARELK